MVKQLTISAFSLSIPKLSSLFTGQSPLVEGNFVTIQCFAGNCYDSAQLLQITQLAEQQQPKCLEWHKPVVLMDQAEHPKIQIFLYRQSASYRQLIAKCTTTLEDLSGSISVISVLQSQKVGDLICKLQVKERGELPRIILKDIKCELIRDQNKLKNNLTSLCFTSARRKYRTQPKTGKLYWRNSVSIFIEDDSNFKLNLLDLKTSQTYFEMQMKKQCFMLRRGIKKTILTNKLHQHIGCLEIEYETYGLRSNEEYDRYAEIEERLSKEIIKIQVTDIKGKLKTEEEGVSVKMLAGNNFRQTIKNMEKSNLINFAMNDYIYADIHEQKCNFVVYCKRDDIVQVLGVGPMMLDMMGKFEKRIKVMSEDHKKDIGYLVIGVSSQKVYCQKIFVSSVNLKFQIKPTESKRLFVKMKIGGWFCRTENGNLQNDMTFDKELQLRYSHEQEIMCSLMDDTNKVLMQKAIALSEFKTAIGQYQVKFQDNQHFECMLHFAYSFIDAHQLIHQTQVIKEGAPTQAHSKEEQINDGTHLNVEKQQILNKQQNHPQQIVKSAPLSGLSVPLKIKSMEESKQLLKKPLQNKHIRRASQLAEIRPTVPVLQLPSSLKQQLANKNQLIMYSSKNAKHTSTTGRPPKTNAHSHNKEPTTKSSSTDKLPALSKSIFEIYMGRKQQQKHIKLHENGRGKLHQKNKSLDKRGRGTEIQMKGDYVLRESAGGVVVGLGGNKYSSNLGSFLQKKGKLFQVIRLSPLRKGRR